MKWMLLLLMLINRLGENQRSISGDQRPLIKRKQINQMVIEVQQACLVIRLGQRETKLLKVNRVSNRRKNLLRKVEQIAQSFPCENHCVTKCLHEDCGLCYLHIHIFFLYIHSPLLLENKVNVITVFLSKLDRPLFNYIYYETVLVWGFVSIWLTNPTHYL